METGAFEGVAVLILGLFNSFYLCFSANFVSNAVESIGEIAYDGNWAEYPLICRKYVLLMILRSQRPVYFTGFKIVSCNLETFVRVRFHSMCILTLS